MSARKREIRRLSDASAPARREWLQRAAYFHEEDVRYLKFLIPEGARVLELGCGTGDLLADLKPSFGVGVDFSEGMIGEARAAHPDLRFFVGDVEDEAFVRSLPGPFDVIVAVDTLGALDLDIADRVAREQALGRCRGGKREPADRRQRQAGRQQQCLPAISQRS